PGAPEGDTATPATNPRADGYVTKHHDLVHPSERALAQYEASVRLNNDAAYLRRELRRFTRHDNIIGRSPNMRAIFDLISTVAPQSSRILITGESGTGKELVARAVHENSSRAQAPFITVNCGAFPETLLESELFGYLKGA